ncbi:MAG TPA: hypothetical protein VHM19_21735, partial [Polyangiales bacterium]|nr:hypothetical protein [Polyangiales bacterium]
MLGGCVARFEQPRLDEPHAVVKLRINYHSFPNTTLHESIQLNRTEVDVTPRGGRGSLDTPLTTAVRVRPEPALWHAYSTFSHVVSHVEHRSRQITEQYPCGTQTIGSITSTRYCTRYRTEWYDVTVNDTIVDAACEATAQHLPKVGATYLLQYDFYEHRRCSLKCYE